MATWDKAGKVSDGDELDDGYFNDSTGIVTIEAGETITAGNVVYFHLTDGKAYVSGTGAADDIRANGICLTGATVGNDAVIQTRGVYTTTGLTDKQDYYLGAAGAISTTLSGVRIGTALSTTQLYIQIVQDDKDAVGTIKPIAVSLTGTPSNNITAFWKTCDGSTLSDAESPYNGQALPDLNNTQRMIRGSTTSGTTGGADTTKLPGGGGADTLFGSSSASDYVREGLASDTGADRIRNTISNLSAYYEAVFYIKVK